MPETVSIRRSLLMSILTAIVLLSIAIIATTGLVFRNAAARLSRTLITETLDKADGELQRFFDPVSRVLGLVQGWAAGDMLDIDDPEAMNRLFVPLLDQLPHVSSVIIADERGREYMLLRDGTTWSARQTRRDEWGDRTRWLEWSGDNPAPVESWRSLDYDPRTRPWFVEAVSRRGTSRAAGPNIPGDASVHWTAPYRFYTTQEPGITASMCVSGQGEPALVAGFDVLLRAVSDFTSIQRFSANGMMIVMTDDGRVIGLPSHPLYDTPEKRAAALLKRPDELGMTLATDANNAFLAQGPPFKDPLRFRSGGDAWWGQGRDFVLAPDRKLFAAVVVPESELLAGVRQMRVWIIGFTLLAIVLTVIRAFVLAGRYGRPLEALAQESDRISRLDLEERTSITSSIREVTWLARAHERMRNSLRNLLKLERDLQVARQIQQQTLPSKLPELNGFEIAGSTEPAEETGGDMYDVIGYRAAGDDRALEITTSNADGALLLLADATGHGVGPALSVSQVRSMLRMALRMGHHQRDIVTNINDQLCADLPEGRFITVWLGNLDAATSTLHSFSAGQGPLLLYRAAEQIVHDVPTQASPMGIMTGMGVEAIETVVMQPGDILAVFSDGFFEAINASGELFGKDRVKHIITSHDHETPERLIEALASAVDAFTDGASPTDDRTAVVVKRLPQ